MLFRSFSTVRSGSLPERTVEKGRIARIDLDSNELRHSRVPLDMAIHADAKTALQGTDAAAMNSAREKLTQASHKLAEAMYKSAQPQGTPGAPPEQGPTPGPGGDGASSGTKKDEGVIDAEYVDVEDKK